MYSLVPAYLQGFETLHVLYVMYQVLQVPAYLQGFETVLTLHCQEAILKFQHTYKGSKREVVHVRDKR